MFELVFLPNSQSKKMQLDRRGTLKLSKEIILDGETAERPSALTQ